MKIALNAVAFQDDGVWTVQCLKHDIAVSAATVAKLRRNLEKAVLSTVAVNQELGREGLDGIPPAPNQFWKMFEAADAQILPIDRRPGSLPVHIAAIRLAELEIQR